LFCWISLSDRNLVRNVLEFEKRKTMVKTIQFARAHLHCHGKKDDFLEEYGKLYRKYQGNKSRMTRQEMTRYEELAARFRKVLASV